MNWASRRRAILTGCLVAMVALGSLGWGVRTASAATPAVTLVTTSMYDVRPDEHRVAVTVNIMATSTLRDTTTRRFYSDRVYLAVLPSATNLRLVASSGKPSVSVSSRSATNTVLLLRFGSQLGAGKSIGLTLTFDIVDPGGAPDRILRISPSLVTFSAWAFGTAGVTGSSVRVRFPAGYAASVGRGPLAGPATEADGRIIYTSEVLTTPGTFVADVTADRPGVLLDSRRSVSIGGRTVILTVRSWPDDPDWRSRVTDVLMRGLPALRRVIGVDWLMGAELEVRETIARPTGGAASLDKEATGAFNPSARRLDIPYIADSTAMLHGAAHAWFNASLVADRWAAEGFADLYAARAGAAIAVAVTSPVMSLAALAHAVPLNAWAVGGPGDDFGYAASLQLARNIVARAGDDALQATWLAAAGGIGAYQPIDALGDGPVPPAERGAGPVDWRSLLDLLEEHSGRSFEPLWRAWVVRPGDAALLDARSEARSRYQKTVAAAAPWILPQPIRDAMRAWQFEEATAEMRDVMDVIEQRATIARAAAAVGLHPPEALRQAFEGTDGMHAAAAEAVTEQAVIDSFSVVVAAQPANPDFVTRIGLIGTDPQGDIVAARAAFAAGELDATVRHAQAAGAIWADAADVGGRRIVSGATIAFAVVVLMWLLVTRSRGPRQRSRRDAHRRAP